MSLDISLWVKGVDASPPRKAIFIRENGTTTEITEEEWYKRYPGKEPVYSQAILEGEGDEIEVFWLNITHNLGKMAEHAGIYRCMWRPEEMQITKAGEMINLLQSGLTKLEADPGYFKQFDPPNKWGSYEGLVEKTREYLDACKRWPEARIHTWR